MPRSRVSQHRMDWEYPFPIPRLDIQGDFRTNPPNVFSRLTGVDGRYRGRLRRFPGFLKKYELPDDITDDVGPVTASWTFGGGNGVQILEPFSITQGATGKNLLRGVAYLIVHDGKDKLAVTYSVNGGSVTSDIIWRSTTALNYIDITIDHGLLYIVGEEEAAGALRARKIELLARYTGSTNKWETAIWPSKVLEMRDAEPGIYDSHDHDADGDEGGENDRSWLDNGMVYGVAMRAVFPDQGFVGPITQPKSIAVQENGESSGYATMQYGDAEQSLNLDDLGNVFTRAVIQVFRTVSNQASFGNEIPTDAHGALFLESEFEVPRWSGTGTDLRGDNWDTFVSGDGARIKKGGGTGTTAGMVVGDTVYLTTKREPSSARDVATNRILCDGMVFRRTVDVIVDANEFTFTPDLPTPITTTQYKRTIEGTTVTQRTFVIDWVVSKDGDQANSNGSFQMRAAEQLFFGWNDTPDGYPASAPVGLRDDALVLQPSLAPEEFATFLKGNPRASFIQEYEDLFVRVTPASAEEDASETDVIRWGNVEKSRRGIVPVLNRKRISDLSDSIVNLVDAGPFLVVVMNNALLRIHRSGSRLALDPIHNRYGAVGRHGAVAIGSNLYMVSPVGVLIADLNSGQVDVVGATQHFFDETGRWNTNLADVQAAYDSQAGALIFLNPTINEMLLIWMNHGVLTHLIDMPWDHVRTGVDFQSGGSKRALFWGTGESGIFEIDALRAATTRSTMGSPAAAVEALSLNGLAGTPTNSTTLTAPASKDFSTDMIGHYVRFFNPTTGAKIGRALITARPDADTVTFAAMASPPAPGDRFAIGAIPFLTTAWPLSGDPETPLQDLFRVKKVTAMGAALGDVSGDINGNPNKVLRYQLYKRDESAVAAEAEGTIDATNTGQTYKAIKLNHTVLVPGVENWSSDLDFDLIGLLVKGSVEHSKQE